MRVHRIVFIKIIHSIIFVFMTACLFYLLYCGIVRRYDWTLLAALGAVSVNGLALLLNRCECPLTTLAKRYGDNNGSVTDILLPMFLARNVFKISMVLVPVELAILAVGYFMR